MRKLYRSLTAVIVLGMMFFVSFGSAFAIPEIPNAVIPVVDETGTLNADQLIMIGDTANDDNNEARVYTYITAEIPAEYDGIGAASDDVFSSWGLGQNNGVLIYIAKADGEINIQIADSLKESLTGEDLERIVTESIIPSLQNDDYAGGIVSGILEINSTIEANTSVLPAGFTTKSFMPYIMWIGAGLVVILAIFIALKSIIAIMKSTNKNVKNLKNDAEQKLKNELDSVRQENKKLISQVQSMKSGSNNFTAHRSSDSGTVDEIQLKNNLVGLYQSNPAVFFSMVEEITAGNSISDSNMLKTTSDYTSSNTGIYDGNKVLDDILLSSTSSNSYDSSSYSSSYGSSYDSGYQTSYSSDFGFNSYASSDSSDSSDSGGSDGGGD